LVYVILKDKMTTGVGCSKTKMVILNFGLCHTKGQNDKTDWSWVLQNKDGDPLDESISSL
jgi:hypothetical protein